MNDREIRGLCAEALGWKHLGAVGVEAPKPGEDKPGLWCLSGGNDWWLNPYGESVCGHCQSIPNPLENDDECFALVKAFPDQCLRAMDLDMNTTKPEGFNRAVCVAVAEMCKARP